MPLLTNQHFYTKIYNIFRKNSIFTINLDESDMISDWFWHPVAAGLKSSLLIPGDKPPIISDNTEMHFNG